MFVLYLVATIAQQQLLTWLVVENPAVIGKVRAVYMKYPSPSPQPNLVQIMPHPKPETRNLNPKPETRTRNLNRKP